MESTETVVPFRARDGFECNLIHVQGKQPPTKGPVMLAHGAGVRANLFRPPVATSLVDFLLAEGYDVWLENWRASIDLKPSHWTLDQAALYDHPAAVETIVKATGASKIKAIIHCQGSTSFMMSAVAGLVPQVTTIISNAVSLHPVVPGFSNLKLRFALPMMGMLTDYLNPQWGLNAPTATAKFVRFAVELTHHECNNPVCKQVSFTYGSGFPALWKHENLNSETHEWIKREFAAVPISFFKQITKCVQAGSLVSVEGKSELPENFVAGKPQTDARFVFLAGNKNLCFLPESQVRTYEYFNNLRKNYHALHLFPTYSHLDVLIGKNSATDVFPIIARELN
jgi:pimeloyl-ACP methyl ester carboxylesterase